MAKVAPAQLTEEGLVALIKEQLAEHARRAAQPVDEAAIAKKKERERIVQNLLREREEVKNMWSEDRGFISESKSSVQRDRLAKIDSQLDAVGYAGIGYKSTAAKRVEKSMVKAVRIDRQNPSPAVLAGRRAFDSADQADQTDDPALTEQPDARQALEKAQTIHDQVAARLRAAGAAQDAPEQAEEGAPSHQEEQPAHGTRR